MNYQNGGWYNNPQTGRNQQYWNGQWFDTPQQGNSGNSGLNDYTSYLNGLNSGTNNFYNQMTGFNQTQHDLQMNQLNTENTQSLGTQGADASNSFLNSIYNPLMKQEGSLQYQYGLDTGHDTNVYNLNSTANQQNRDLALQKLATDEQNQLNALALSHGQQNQQTAENLNSRGLLYGQKPTGMYQDTSLGGMHGLANQQAGLVNTDFANQRNQVVQPYNLQVLGTNEGYTQQQNMYNENHNYDLANSAANTVNQINQQNANYAYNTGMANNSLAMYNANLERQRQAQLQANTQTANQNALQKNNAYVYG